MTDPCVGRFKFSSYYKEKDKDYVTSIKYNNKKAKLICISENYLRNFYTYVYMHEVLIQIININVEPAKN